MKYVRRPKSASAKDIDIGKNRYCIDIAYADIAFADIDTMAISTHL